jgi:hypothetical protein
MSSFTASADVQVGRFLPGFRKFARKAVRLTPAYWALRGVKKVAHLRGDDEDINVAYGGCGEDDLMGKTLFQKFLSKTIVGKLLTKTIGKIPVVGGAASAAVSMYANANIQQPSVSLPAAAPVTVADVTPLKAGSEKRVFPIVPVAIGAGALVLVAAIVMLKKK